MFKRNVVLEYFESNKGEVISAYELSKVTGINIFKTIRKVKKLKKEGHNIINVGFIKYILGLDSDIVSAEGIKVNLDNYEKEFRVKCFEEIDSTNKFAKKVSSTVPNKTVIVANSQTNGVGRMGREFYSPKDNGIYMSVILKKKYLPSDLSLLTVAAASAVSKAIEKTVNIKTEIKWVNDIFVNGKKVSGILTETTEKTAIIGIGINVKSTDGFPEELKDIAGALNIYSVKRNEIIAAVLREISDFLSSGNFALSLPYYREKSMVLNKTIHYEKDGVSESGKVISINDSGNLVVEHADGKTSVICSGEIRLKPENIF